MEKDRNLPFYTAEEYSVVKKDGDAMLYNQCSGYLYEGVFYVVAVAPNPKNSVDDDKYPMRFYETVWGPESNRNYV